MIIKRIELFLGKDTYLQAKLFLQSHKTDLTRTVDYHELDKVNIGDDIQVKNNKIIVLNKINKNKYLLPTVCPECGSPLKNKNENFTTKEEKIKNDMLYCTNLFGCKGQRENFLINWCKHFKINALLPYTTEFLQYFSLDNFILNRTQKLATEKVVPLLYTLNELELTKWTKNVNTTKQMLKQINQTKTKIKLFDVLTLLPNDLTTKNKLKLNQYKTIANFLTIDEREKQNLINCIGEQQTKEVFNFIEMYKDFFAVLAQVNIPLDNL